MINMLKNGDMDKDLIEEQLRSLKSEYFTTSNSSISNKVDFDIFGSMKDDSTQVKYLNNKSHRENEKDKFQILNINKKIDIFDFTEKLQLIASSLNESMHKISFDYDMPIYQVTSINEKLHQTDYNIFNINAERELQSYDNKFETAVKLFKLNFKEGYPAVFLTNATYFDNVNNTLPNGMDVTSKLIIDANMFDYELVKKDKIKTNRYFNLPEELYPRVLTVYIEEYDVTLKSDKKVAKAEKKEENKETKIDEENIAKENESNDKEEKIKKVRKSEVKEEKNKKDVLEEKKDDDTEDKKKSKKEKKEKSEEKTRKKEK